MGQGLEPTVRKIKACCMQRGGRVGRYSACACCSKNLKTAQRFEALHQIARNSAILLLHSGPCCAVALWYPLLRPPSVRWTAGI